MATIARNEPENGPMTISSPRARANFGKLLQRVETERRSVVIETRGFPKAVLLSIQDYAKLAAPEPEVLKLIGEESEQNGTSTMTPSQIQSVIRATRADRKKRD